MLRSLPAVHEVITAPAIQALVKNYDHDMIVAMIRETLEQLRQQLRENQSGVKDITIDGIADDVASRLAISIKPKLRMVINATGVVLHTNLGRAPLAEEAARAAYEAGRGYLNLELDLESGKRSSRQETVRDWICRLLGCESGTVVNNNAAATVIALRALAKG